MKKYHAAFLFYLDPQDTKAERKKTLATLPNPTITGSLMGADEAECYREFEAEDDEAAKYSPVLEQLSDEFMDFQVFCVNEVMPDGSLRRAFTEEDM